MIAATDSETTARSVDVWVGEGTWRAAIDAALSLVPVDASFTLPHVTDDEVPDASRHARRARTPGKPDTERNAL